MMDFSWELADIARTAIYLLLAVAGFIVCIKLLKLVVGIIIGFALTLFLAYMYFC